MQFSYEGIPIFVNQIILLLYMEISQKNFISYILKVAIISGIARVTLDYLFRILELSPIAYYLTFVLAFILEVYIIVFVIKKYKQHKTPLTIIDALKTGIIIMGVIGLFYCTMAYIYDMYIDPDFQTNMTLRFTEQFTPDQVEQTKQNLANQDHSKSYFGVIMYTIWFVFLGAVISLLVGSIYKTKEASK
ncbi:DUF4199 domain-containing protein [Aquimarina litoralis]|uniref:DUF4199 domain-containing protein n=1 Tax=Aquimarina litoralis TaxID=584605 RepID=UPI001C55E51F|nr:DUF4199 domain-containing protein [Aquimarina litoralis]MBW1295735.1 DUF4199 family protein [Aquimarina litoralis]